MNTEHWAIKDPKAVRDVTFSYAQFLRDGETITAVDVTVSPSGLNVDEYDTPPGEVVVWLSGGFYGVTYSVVVTVTTSDGRKEPRTLKVLIAKQ